MLPGSIFSTKIKNFHIRNCVVVNSLRTVLWTHTGFIVFVFLYQFFVDRIGCKSKKFIHMRATYLILHLTTHRQRTPGKAIIAHAHHIRAQCWQISHKPRKSFVKKSSSLIFGLHRHTRMTQTHTKSNKTSEIIATRDWGCSMNHATMAEVASYCSNIWINNIRQTK